MFFLSHQRPIQYPSERQSNLGHLFFNCFTKMNCVNSESIDNMKLRIKDHYAAVLNQAPSDNLVKVLSDSFPLTNKYDY